MDRITFRKRKFTALRDCWIFKVNNKIIDKYTLIYFNDKNWYVACYKNKVIECVPNIQEAKQAMIKKYCETNNIPEI